MPPREYIIAKQRAWAANSEVAMHAVQNGYTETIADNLFTPLALDAIAELRAGDGGELNGDSPKIQALHSSAAIAVNFFHYWRDVANLSPLASACRLIRAGSPLEGTICFEKQFEIDQRFDRKPNLDVVIDSPDLKRKTFAIECKFTEPYGNRGHRGISPYYLAIERLWTNLPATQKLAQRISPNNEVYDYLDAAQLIKHILGLNEQLGRSRYRLLYLWYDTFGTPGANHRQEVDAFAKIVKSDGVDFLHITYQESLASMSMHRVDHADYVKYMSERYM